MAAPNSSNRLHKLESNPSENRPQTERHQTYLSPLPRLLPPPPPENGTIIICTFVLARSCIVSLLSLASRGPKTRTETPVSPWQTWAAPSGLVGCGYDDGSVKHWLIEEESREASSEVETSMDMSRNSYCFLPSARKPPALRISTREP